MAQYVATNMHISPVPANDGNNNISLLSNIWPAETAAALDTLVGDTITSAAVPTYYMPVPVPGPFIGVAPMIPSEEQSHFDPLVYTSLLTPWWLDSPGGVGTINNLRNPATSFEATILNIQDSKTTNVTFANPATALSQLNPLPTLRHDSLPRRTSITLTALSSGAATVFDSIASRPAVSSTCDIDALQDPTNPLSNVDLPTPGVKGHTNPRRPARPNHNNAAQRTSQSLLPVTQPQKRSRNRAASHKCRSKSKAAAAVLEALESTESQRCEHLLATFRTLQADVLTLKSEILFHANCGDRLIHEYLDSAARSFVPGAGGAGERFAPGDGWWVPNWTNMPPAL